MATISMDTRPDAVVHAPSRQPTATSRLTYDPKAVDPVVLVSVEAVRDEIDEAFKDIRTFHNREPDEIMRLISGHSGRMSELRVRIHRIEGQAPYWEAIRKREIEPLLEELQKQFQLASRQLTVRELDWKMETGAR